MSYWLIIGFVIALLAIALVGRTRYFWLLLPSIPIQMSIAALVALQGDQQLYTLLFSLTSIMTLIVWGVSNARSA